MLYIDSFSFPTMDYEHNFFMGIQRTCYDTFYPFQVLHESALEQVRFEPITIFYGGNGSGKTTALNIMAEKLGLMRDTLFNRSNFYEDYLTGCSVRTQRQVPQTSRIITSDDVFDYMLNIRALNEGIHQKRKEVFEDYLDSKYARFKFRTMEDYDQLKKVNKARRMTQSKFTRSELIDNVRTLSNGESGFKYFTEKIKEPGLYLLDEPENSLSPLLQMELVTYLEDSVRFFGCQFVIATHSPLLLAMQGALIYDLDEKPAKTKDWTELENIRVMYDFFKAHQEAFE